MKPEYLEKLADKADPEELWRLPALSQLDLPPSKREQLDAGVALRRHAHHIRDLARLLESKRSMCITPLSENSSAIMSIDTPPRHANLRAQHWKAMGNEDGRLMRWHELKTDPDTFDAVANGYKTHEIRLNDRDFKVGDGLTLRRTLHTGAAMRDLGMPLIYVGNPLSMVVTHILEGYGLTPGWVIMSIKPYDPIATGILLSEEEVEQCVVSVVGTPGGRDGTLKDYEDKFAAAVQRAFAAKHGITMRETTN